MEKGPRNTSLPLLLLLLLFFVGSWAEEATCPLAANSEEYFYATPRSSRPVEGEDPSPTCCKSAWVDNSPFAQLTEKMTGDVSFCQFKLNKMAQLLCSPNQATVTSSHPVLGVAYVCDSYCNDLLETCGELTWKDSSIPFATYYKGDGDYFCKDLFKDPTQNLTASVLPLSSRKCLDDNVRECNSKEGDFTGFYTECDVASVTREYHYQFEEGVKCTGGEKLPEPNVGLPCGQGCEPGSFLPVGELECQECEAGYFSVGGGYLFEQWKDWPSEFEWETHCETNNGVDYDLHGEPVGGNCKGWLVNDTFVESSPVLEDLQSSVLNMKAVLVREGSITFTYRVDAEPNYDGLLFKIDNVTKMRSYTSPTMETKTFPVSPGTHFFSWVYFKDFSNSRGKDQALIDSIQVLGAKLADSFCSHCNPGSYSQGGAAKCSPCEANKYAGWYGATQCEPCEADKFSYPGAVECNPRQPCLSDAYFSSYTVCTPEGRNKVYEFAQPMICDASNFTLPEEELNIPCADCNPGLYRASGSSSCEICPVGSYSSIVGATSCDDCSAGTSAVKELFYTQFDTFSELKGVTTWCSGDCATDGWRLMSDDIDSGVGHGNVYDSVLQIETELIQDGKAHVKYSVVCKDFCKITVVDVNVTGGYYTRYVFADLPNESFEVDLEKGAHQIQIVFSQYLEIATTSRENRMIVHEFNITGVKHAGATSCGSCPAGTYSPEKSESCIPCPPGSYSQEGAASCSTCEEGFYAPDNGSSQCLPCGAGTTSTPSFTGCDLNHCQFEVEAGKIMYDLSAIISNQEMYGPVWGGNTAFFLSPCQKEHGVHSCVDENQEPIPTFACKQAGLGATGVDIGHVQGYHALEDHVEGFNDFKRAGLTMTFDQGANGCNSSDNPTPFHSSVLFLCEPNAGIGYPEIITPADPCTYKFQWESLYACPVCTSADYYPVFGKCEDGVAIKSYLPNSYPNRCHGGEMPDPEQVDCDDSSVVCELGTYLPLTLDDGEDSENNDTNNCVPASPGHFSIGGGIIADVFDSWDTVPLEFGRESTWVFLGELIRSGEGDSELNAYIDVVRGGSVEFDFKLANYDGNNEKDAGFYFYVDNSPTPLNLTSQSLFSESIVNVPLQAGRHTLTWLFVGGKSPQENTDSGVYVVIDKILITGTATSARSETPCREGTYQDLEGQYNCKTCPPDTYCGSGESMYHECFPEQYALPGSSSCEEKEPCTMLDYSFYFSECEDGKRTFYYEQLDPGCVEVEGVPAFGFANGAEMDCPVCPEGYFLEDNVCVGCPLGQYLDQDSKKCEDVPSGTYGETKMIFFGDDPINFLPIGSGGTQKLPEEFHTFCSGTCETDGWRMMGGLAQSGYYSPYSEVESVLEMEVDFVQEGSVSFTYSLVPFSTRVSLSPSSNPARPGFLFYLDGIQKETVYHPNSDAEQTFFLDKIEQGKHNLTFVYHQPLQVTAHKQIYLSNLEITGSSLGGASEYKDCPAGTYSEGGQKTCTPCEAGKISNEEASSCDLCPYDKYTDQEGSPTCLPCGNLVNASEDRTYCNVECTFYNIDTNHTYDVTPLSQRFSVNDGKGLRYEISLCEKLDPLAAQCQVKDSTFVCISEMSEGKIEQEDGGHLQNIYFAGGVDDESLQLVFSEGSDCEPRGQKSTEINFICDPQADLPMPPTLISRENCYSKFEWTHRSACPVCSEEDYETDYGSCVDGEKQIMKVRKTACNGPDILSKTTESCRSSSIYFIALGVLVAVLVILVAVFAIRHKTLSDRYEMLVSSSNISPSEERNGPELEEDEEVGDLKL